MPFLYRIAALLAVLAPLFAAPVNAQAPERRFALVIGIANTRRAAADRRQRCRAHRRDLAHRGASTSRARAILIRNTLRRSIREFLDKGVGSRPASRDIRLSGGLRPAVRRRELHRSDRRQHFAATKIFRSKRSGFPTSRRPLAGTPGAVKLFVVDAARQHPFRQPGHRSPAALRWSSPIPAC